MRLDATTSLTFFSCLPCKNRKFCKSLRSRVTILFKNITPQLEAKQGKLNRVREKAQRTEKMRTYLRWSTALRHFVDTYCVSRAFRFPIDAQRVLGAMECQSRKRQDKQEDKRVAYWQSRQTSVWTMYTIRSQTGLTYRWNPSEVEFHPRYVSLPVFTDCQVRCHVAQTERTLEMTNELEKFFITLYAPTSTNLRG